MKIFINSNNEIKAINKTTDINLIEVEVDREKVFENMSDFMILHYKYIATENGYMIEPYIDPFKLLELDYKNKIEEHQEKVACLQAENNKLKEIYKQQSEDLAISMLAITEMYESSSVAESISIKKVPAYIQTVYQKLYELNIKEIEEIPFEVGINLKAK